MTPKDAKYSRDHEWVRVKDGEATVGITDYAQHQLGDVVFVELPAAGARLKQFETFGAVESVKSANDLYAPVGGDVAASNEKLGTNPELVNESPYEDGWMVRVRVADPGELNNLMSAEEYEEYLKTLEA